MSQKKEPPKEFGPVASAAADAMFLREDFTMVERSTDLDPKDLSDHMFLTWVWNVYIMAGISQTPEFLKQEYLKSRFMEDLKFDFAAPPWYEKNVNTLRLVADKNQNWMWGIGFYDAHYHHLNSKNSLGRSSKKEVLELVSNVLRWEMMDKQGKFMLGDNNGEEKKRHFWNRGAKEEE